MSTHFSLVLGDLLQIPLLSEGSQHKFLSIVLGELLQVLSCSREINTNFSFVLGDCFLVLGKSKQTSFLFQGYLYSFPPCSRELYTIFSFALGKSWQIPFLVQGKSIQFSSLFEGNQYHVLSPCLGKLVLENWEGRGIGEMPEERVKHHAADLIILLQGRDAELHWELLMDSHASFPVVSQKAV